MSIIQRIRTAKHGVHVALLLLSSLLNAGHFQSSGWMPVQHGSASRHSADIAHAAHADDAGAAASQPERQGGCASDDGCKAKCAWFCQLAQAIEPPSALSAECAWGAGLLPVYHLHLRAGSPADLNLRPPISV